MIIKYIKKQTARAIVAIVNNKIKSLQAIEDNYDQDDRLFLRCQFKINVLEEVRLEIVLKYQLYNPKTQKNG